MINCKLVDTPIALGTKLSKQDEGPSIDFTLYKSLVSSLLYLTITRPDIMFVASFVSILMESPKNSHWKVAKIILGYVAGGLNYGLLYNNYEDFSLSSYTDNDYGVNIDDFGFSNAVS